jgi:hypothetical protein
LPELKIYAPTYYGEFPEVVRDAKKLKEFDSPEVPVVIRPADGVRIVLGTHDYWDHKCPDIQIERRAGGWVIFLHPVPGDDLAGHVYFLDDGRSYFKADGSCYPELEILGVDERPHGLDRISD